MSKEEKFPELSERDKRIINECFTPYLFFSSIPNGKEFWCTYCGEHFCVDGLWKNSLEYYAMTGNHNSTVTCPHCGHTVTLKNVGRSKTRQNLWEEQRVMFIRPRGKNKVIVQCYICEKNYRFGLQPFPEACEKSRYILTPGKARKFSYSYYSGWNEEKIAREPFPLKGSMYYYTPPDNSYTVIGLDKLKKTFLKYQMLDDYVNHTPSGCGRVDVKIMSYLCRFAEYPQIEMLQKLGHYDVVRNLVENYKKSYPFVNWNAVSPPDFFKLSSQEYKQFKTYGGNLDLLKIRRTLKKIGYNDSVKTAAEVKNIIGIVSTDYYLNDVIDKAKVRRLDAKSLIKYILKQAKRTEQNFSRTQSMYFDYYDAAKDVGYDLSTPIVMFPNNLLYHHDRAIETHRAFLEEKKAQELKEKEKAAKEQLKRNDRQYQFASGQYMIIVPHTVEDIIREGKLQHHCVGGYAGRHMEGKLTICFLRKVTAPEQPLYTIEMHNKQLTQVQGYGNHTPLTKSAQKFFDKWLAWVAQGSKRNKNGEPIIKQPQTA